VLTATKDTMSYTLTASGKAARTYVLERSNTLGTGAWTEIRSVGPLTVDGPVRLTDPAPPVNAAFYRLRVTSP